MCLTADGTNDSMQFYNSQSKSIAGASIGRDQQTPLSMLHRATPVNRTLQETPTLPPYSATHRATPVSPYKLADQSPWKDGQYFNQASYGPQVSTVLNYDVDVLPADAYGDTGYPSYIDGMHLPENDCNGKYSTGSADSGVHSNSPVPRARTPTDFSDHQISPNDQKKTIKNETYV